jgi:Ca-activated chloride channel homolog
MKVHIAYPLVLQLAIPLLIALLAYRLFLYKRPRYTFPLAGECKTAGIASSFAPITILFWLRVITLALLAFMASRPQWSDSRTHTNINGVDIMLALDVSGSMQCFDDPSDLRSRLETAKAEAINFIDKRTDDLMGITIFAREALSSCPLTLDKNMLKEVVGELSLDSLPNDGTWLGTGIATAVNRLKQSKAKSKIIVLLTDGQPTPPEKIDVDTALQLAIHHKIKIYTIGIGNPEGGFVRHPFMGFARVENSLNTKLLEKIAHDTGGKFFQANKPKDLRKIYNDIDKLEKTEQETNLFAQYYEAFLSFIWIALFAFCTELLLKLLVWRGL